MLRKSIPHIPLTFAVGVLAVPGTVAATLIERPIEPVEGIPLDAPLIYYYGASSPSDNPEHFTYLQEKLAQVRNQSAHLGFRVLRFRV